MNTTLPQEENPEIQPSGELNSMKHDPSAWAAPMSRLRPSEVPPGAININVEGRQVSGALQGFGQLWQKTFRVRLSGLQASPEEVMKAWKENFPKFQPPENRFYPPMIGVKPGEVLFISGKVPAIPGTPKIMPVSSGVMVLYADDFQFTVMTPQGFPESGWNTFSVFDDDGTPVAQVQTLCRAADPLYELYFRFLGSSAQQDQVWTHVLTSLAGHFGIPGNVTVSKTCLDPKIQWKYARNFRYNAGVWTVFYILSAPFRGLKRAFMR